MAHIYNGILLSHKEKRSELFVVRWMDLGKLTFEERPQNDKGRARWEWVGVGNANALQ